MRVCFRLLGAVLISSIFVFARSPQANPVSAFELRLIDQQKQFLQASQSKDSTSVERAVADDFQGIQENGDLYDKSDVVESARDGMPKDMRAYEFHVVKLTNDSAVVAYNLIVPGDHPRYRHMADTWAKIDGRWKLKFRQITPNLWSANDTD
jgi:hypothetical protein